MCKTVAVTNSLLCKDDFLLRVNAIAQSGVDAIVLREKHLSAQEYLRLAEKVIKICEKSGVKFIAHGSVSAAKTLQAEYLQLPLDKFTGKTEGIKTGVSVHSTEEAVLAEKLGASYLTAGHIFATDCKKGLKPRGTAFLREICKNVSVPVFAIGGITEKNAALCINAGGAGVFVMSGYMKGDSPLRLTAELKCI